MKTFKLFLALTITVLVSSCSNFNHYSVAKKYAGNKEVFAVNANGGKPFVVTDTTSRKIYLYQVSNTAIDSVLIASW